MDALYPEEENQNQKGNLNQIVQQQQQKNKRVLIRFRDDAEILQATQFLHENGILIHYNDLWFFFYILIFKIIIK